MLLIGLTGGIGSGKSTVSAMLADRGAVVIDADAIVRELQAPGQPVLAAGFALAALAILVALAAGANWLLQAGFTPLWGALTFPLAAAATAAMLALGAPGFWIGGLLTLAATALNPWVAQQVLKSWAKGDLGAKTNAATA